MKRYFAIITNNKVKNFTIVDKDTVEESILFLNTYFNDPSGFWKYVDTSQDRYKACSVNASYNSEEDYFFYEKPLNSWIYNKDKYRWEPPIPYPDGEWDFKNISNNKYEWNENSLSWILKY
jgi:hypothetical protein